MSWSFQAVGKVGAVIDAIETGTNNKLTGQSLDEWNDAKPALLALARGNVGNVAIRINANGHAAFSEGVKISGQCSCVVEPLHGFVS